MIAERDTHRHIHHNIPLPYWGRSNNQCTLCLEKKDPRLFFSYNSSNNCPIFIIFGTYINKRLGNQIIFSQLTYIVSLHYLVKQENAKIASFSL